MIQCKNCDSKMDKLISKTSWTNNYRCSNKLCHLRYQIILGDYGSKDDHLYQYEPFEEANPEIIKDE